MIASGASGALTQDQAAEVARLRKAEKPHKIAERLGIPTRAVKAEIRRLSREESGARSAPGLARVLAVIAPLALSATLVLFAKHHRRDATAQAPAAIERGETLVARAIYAGIDSGRISTEKLCLACSDADPEVRLAGVRGYAKRPPATRDPGPLTTAIDDPEQRVRMAALQSLGELGSPAVAPLLESVTASQREDSERKLAAESLGRTPSEGAIEALVQTLTDRSPVVRQAAWNGLCVRLDSNPGTKLEDVLNSPAKVHEVFVAHLAERAQ